MPAPRPRTCTVLLCLAGALGGGCAVGPDFHAPARPAVERYTAQPLESGASADGAEPLVFVPWEAPREQWWRGFASDDLDRLVEQALHAHPTLQAAEASLRQALENVAAQRGAYFPQLTAQASASRNRNAVQVLAPTLTSGTATFSLFTPQLTVAFVPDLFGANRRQVESLGALAEASRDEYDAAYLTLVGNVVSAAIQESGLRAQIAATRRVIELEQESLGVMHTQFELGAIAEADVRAQEAALAQLEASLPPLQKAADLQRDLLDALTGRLPGDAPEPAGVIDLERLAMPERIPVGVASELVERRPDVRAAQAQLHAATAAVGVALAAMLPQITLNGTIGQVATQTGQLFAGMNQFWTVGASLSETLFAGGTLLHHERAARAALDAAGAQYRLTVLSAFQNVADALRTVLADEAELRAEERACQASEASLSIVRSQLALGAVSSLALISAEQGYQQALVGRTQARMNRLVDTAALYQSLGGRAPPI
jgi:NodT family efflux transporter outer membrane factor (OMF) lipoprotein